MSKPFVMIRERRAPSLLKALLIHLVVFSWTSMGCTAIPADGNNNQNDNTQNSISIQVKADFGASAQSKRHVARSACPDIAPDNDAPEYEVGLDCDGDGGQVQFVTPDSYRVAIKHLSFLRSDGGEPFDVIPDTGTLAQSRILDITSPVTLDVESPPAGVYSQYVVDLYYYELSMPLYDADLPQTIRIYMSDDDLAAEGGLGHHQGDITLVDANGDELGFVTTADRWAEGSLLDSRGSTNGAGGTDPETGHLRGLFGDPTFWNQSVFQQGADSDICRLTGTLNLTVDDTGRTVTFTFNAADSWFYEDFDANGRFNPCDPNPGDACAANAAWAPLFAEPAMTITETPVTTGVDETDGANTNSTDNSNDNNADNGNVA